jgi:hypothetical protein
MSLINIKFDYFARNARAWDLLEKFFVSAVTSILVIRVYLGITGYPQIGGGDFHVAHMLFGGFLMMLSLVVLLIFLNMYVKDVAAVVGGIGFGTFIDELGKFITNDNDYLYEPAIAIIYVIFVLLFLFFKLVTGPIRLKSREYTINALEIAKEVVLQDLDVEEKKKALAYLGESDENDSVARILKNTLQEISALPTPPKSWFYIIKSRLGKLYVEIIKTPLFLKVIPFLYLAFLLINFLPILFTGFNKSSFADKGILFSTSLALVFILLGIYLLSRRKRLVSFNIFRVAVLITIFLTQFFYFLKNQLPAVLGLGLNLIILGVVDYLVNQERLRVKKREGILDELRGENLLRQL